MNHIFKTVFNPNSGKIQAVSEHASGQCKSQSGTIKKGQINSSSQNINMDEMVQTTSSLKSTLASSIALIMTTLCSSAAFAQVTYTGDNKDLTTSIDVGGNFHQLIGNDAAKGVMSTDTPIDIDGVPTVSGNHVIVDYASGTTPDFIVAGYANAHSDDTVETLAVTNHTVDLKQGNINGPVYAGLAHVTNVTADINCSDPAAGCKLIDVKNDIRNKTFTTDHNIIQVLNESPIQVKENLFAGYSGVNVRYGDLVAADNSISTNTISYINTFSSNDNQISIIGNDHIFHDISSGYAGINTHYGDLTTVNTNADTYAHIYAIAHTETTTLSGNANQISISGSNNSFNNLSSGYSGINLHYGNLIAAEAYTNAYDYTYVVINANPLSSNNNQIVISGKNNIFHDISSGHVGINLHYGDLIAANTNNDIDTNTTAQSHIKTNDHTLWNTLISNDNQVTISGNEHIFNNISAGYAGVNILYGDLTAANANVTIDSNINPYASAFATSFAHAYTDAADNMISNNNNWISITGNANTINNINSGYAEINIQNGDLTAANADAHADTNLYDRAYVEAYTDAYTNVSVSTLDSNHNQISITGDNNIFHDISSGYAGINIHYGNLTSANANAYAISHSNTDAYSSIYTNASASTLLSNHNQITISGNNDTFHDISSGYVEMNFQYGDLTAGNAYVTTYIGTNGYPSAHTYAYTNASGNLILSNDNKISISGNQNSFNNINAGYAGIDLQYGDLKGGKTINNGVTTYDQAYLQIDAAKTTLSASNNTINLTGSSTINGNLHTGDINFNIGHGTVQNGDGSTVPISVHTNDSFIPNSDSKNYINLNGTQATATHNTISIDGEHQFTNPEATIYGGYLTYNTVNGVAYKPESYDVFTGNTLNYANKTPIRIKEIANFQTYNFTLTPELGNTGTALISAQNVSLGTNQNNISTGENTASDMKVSGIHSGKLVSTGTEFVLLKGDNFAGNATAHRTTGAIQQGISLIYDVETKVDTANKQVTATILSGHDDSGPKVNPQLKSIVESNLAGLMLLTRSGDDLADDALKTIALQNQKKGLVPFVYSSGHIARYNTDSTIDANGGLITAGLSFQNDKLTLAVFSENGWASFDTTSHFDQADSVKANGTNRFHGGGLLAQYDFDHGLYTDASLRAGRLYNSYKTDDIRNAATGETARFKINDSYLGGHVGIGYQFAINANNRYNLNLKYLWAKTDSHDLTIAGDPIHLEQLKSNRLRLNGENSYQFTPNWSLLSSVGLEYEFDAKAQGLTYDRFTIDPSDVTGLSALGSIGVRYQPVNNQRLTVDFKGSGYVGERDGGSALLHLKYAF